MDAGPALQGRPGPAAAAAAMALGAICGVAWQLQQAEVLPPRAELALGVAAVLLAGLAWPWRRRWTGVGLLALAAAGLGGASTDWRATARLADALDPALEGQGIEVVGLVAEMPRLGAQGTRFVLETESATLGARPVRVPEKLSLGWNRQGDDDSLLAAPGEDLRAGQRWRLTVRLKAPHGTFNPGGFDVELWLFEQGIAATGSVQDRANSPAVKLADAVGHPVERARQRIRDAVLARVGDAAAAGVLVALAIGYQAAIDREGWDLFRATGVAHLMSISGLHVTMFAWLAGGLAARLWRLQPRLLLACPAPNVALCAGWLAATGYALLAGWGVPAQRTVWMIGTVVLLRGLGWRWPLHAVLLAAALVVTWLDPWALLQPGFWLSYGAVALLVASDAVHAPAGAAGQGWRAVVLRSVRGGLRTQLLATVGLTPLTLVFFQQISVVGFLANLLAIPLVTLLITPLALLGILAPPLWLAAAALVQALTAGLQALAAWPGAVWTAAAAPVWAMVAGLLGSVVVVLPWPWRLRLLGLALMLPLLAPPVERPPEGHFEVQAADIGQGTAVLIRTARHLLLFDTGPQTAPDADAGSRVLLPLLRVRGEARIDTLVLSHRDSDHVGGAAAVLNGLPVGALRSSLTDDHPLLALAARRGVPHTRCAAGQGWDWDGVHFALLHPTALDHDRQLKSNALSCVLRVSGGGRSALLTGDIEAPQELALLERSPQDLPAEILIVPHHGSRTSSTAAFLDAVAPRTAIVQAGYRSRYGHPAPDVVARYTERGIEVVRSDRCGAWTLPAAGLPTCERQVARRYWHHRFNPRVSVDP